MARIFTPGEYEAARLYIACLTKHSYEDSFDPDEIGFCFGEDHAAALSPNDQLVTTKDFIRAALKIMEGQLENLSKTLGIEIPELVSHLGLAVAKENPEDA